MTTPDTDARFMELAILSCRQGIDAGQTPFGAVIVGRLPGAPDEIVIQAHNQVWSQTDITAHAEVTAIRAACRQLGTIDLSGCRIYSTTEPCPMCFAACHWARLDRIVYGASIADAAAAGFNELPISNERLKSLGNSRIEIVPGLLRDQCVELFELWKARPGRRAY